MTIVGIQRGAYSMDFIWTPIGIQRSSNPSNSDDSRDSRVVAGVVDPLYPRQTCDYEGPQRSAWGLVEGLVDVHNTNIFGDPSLANKAVCKDDKATMSPDVDMRWDMEGQQGLMEGLVVEANRAEMSEMKLSLIRIRLSLRKHGILEEGDEDTRNIDKIKRAEVRYSKPSARGAPSSCASSKPGFGLGISHAISRSITPLCARHGQY
ncbi:hypothetical protein B0H17DRAFT_1152133 [Mycena rosella]|uniref:Uncharacterized protein n=1 Tax=Mycena rosella TaxID=1033263 RepID=A0AAD7BEQ6_MYCRO|nr:hypothetical protein B0H17DRAFT_1152133 [Mycena rosella]